MRKIFLILILLIFAASVSADAKTCSVSGRIVDDNGNPVSEALIYKDGYHQDDVDVIIVAHSPKEDGTFSIENYCETGTAYLWIISKFNVREIFVPIMPPFDEFAGKTRRYPLFAGILFKGRDVKLGDIKIQIPYRNVRVNLQNETGGALFASRDDFAEIVFKIKNERGIEMTFISSLSGEQLENEKVLGDSSILMSLPEGRWIIEIKLRRGKGKTLYPDQPVEVKNSNAPVQEVVLKMSRKKSDK